MKIFNWTRCAFIILSLVFGLWALNAQLNPPSKKHYNPSKTYSEGTLDKSFTPPPNNDFNSQLTKPLSPKEIEEWQAKRSDLAAQWKTADMTQLASRLGFLGVILLIWTIVETLNAGKELARQNEITGKAGGPFIDVVGAELRISRYNDCTLEIAVRNTGNAAARNLTFSGIMTLNFGTDDNGNLIGAEPRVEDIETEAIVVSPKTINVTSCQIFDWNQIYRTIPNVGDYGNGISTADMIPPGIVFAGNKVFDSLIDETPQPINLWLDRKIGDHDRLILFGTGVSPSARYYEKKINPSS